MDKVDIRNDNNPDDNKLYNSDRNKCIIDALEYSTKLYEEVKDENLYSDDLASYFRK